MMKKLFCIKVLAENQGKKPITNTTEADAYNDAYLGGSYTRNGGGQRPSNNR